MAGLGHIAVGMATGKWRTRAATRATILSHMLFYVSLAMLPDADVIGFYFKIPYASQFGHRGALHSFAFAILVGAIVFVAAQLRKKNGVGPALVATLVVASHGMLDAMTDGGLGVALLWPLSDHRYFLPFRPIPVSPIGKNIFTSRGLYVAITELMLFAPFFVYLAWPRRKLKS